MQGLRKGRIRRMACTRAPQGPRAHAWAWKGTYEMHWMHARQSHLRLRLRGGGLQQLLQHVVLAEARPVDVRVGRLLLFPRLAPRGGPGCARAPLLRALPSPNQKRIISQG